MRSHSHEQVEVMVMFGGQLSVRIGRQTLFAKAGDILFYPTDTPHREQGVGTEPLDFIYFAIRGGPASGPVVAHDHQGRVRVLAEWLLREQFSDYTRKREVMNAILGNLVAEYQKIIESESESHPLVRSVDSFLRIHLHEPVTVSDIARQVHMSRAHFIRNYKSLTGKSPMTVLRMLRVESARDKIITTRLPLKQIASETGFYDEHHLSHTFRKLLAVSPSYFRKN